jgi:O-phosphoseryl-tRNA(Cys) synthetase
MESLEHIFLTVYICTANLKTIPKMTAENKEKKRKITVISYYRLLKHKQKGKIKEVIMETCGWSESTFQYKMVNSNFDKLELEATEKIINEFKTGERVWN